MSRISDTLEGKTLLLTGVTGFFGKALLAKLLWDLPEVRRLYALMRPDPGAADPLASARSRLEREVLRSSALLPLRHRHREAFSVWAGGKVVPLAGDVSQEGLGLDPALRSLVADECDLIINSAASVSFDERLDRALELNTFGPARVLVLARARRSIPLVQVSTAYVCGDRIGSMPEEPPETGHTPSGHRGDLDALLSELRAVCLRTRDADAEAGHRTLVREGLERARALGWPDVYTMTKALGEQLLVRERGPVPLCLLRPTIMESALREPQAGWVDGLRMLDPVIIAYGRGQLRDFPTDPRARIDIVPVDLVVNATLAAAAALLRTGGLSVYHVATGEDPLTVGELAAHLHEYFGRHPLRNRAGRPVPVRPWRFPSHRAFERRYRWARLLPLRAVRHMLAMPSLASLRKRLMPSLTARMTAVEQALKLAELYAPYGRLACRFETHRLRALMDALEPEERARLPCDPRGIMWRDYIQDIHIPGLKRFVLHLEDAPGAAQAKADALRQAPAVAPAPPVEQPRTLPELLARAARMHGAATALEIKQGDRYVEYSFQEVARLTALVGERLLARGVGAGDRMGLLAENRPEWGISYLGAACQGIVVVPLDPKLPESELEDLLRRTGARALLSTDRHVRAFSGAVLQRLTAPEANLTLLDLDGFGLPFPGLDPRGRPRAIGRKPSPEDVASIVFTSGTTVAPRGVLLTHGNFLANVRAVTEALRPLSEDRFLSVLPLHHVFEFTCGFLTPLWGGARVTYLPTLGSAQIAAAMRERGISVLLGVPRLYQLLAQGIEARIASGGAVARTAARVLTRLAARADMRTRRALFRPVHRALGGRLRLLVSGGAPLSPELFDTFRNWGFVLCEGYGLTEAAPVLAVNRPERPRRGAVGLPLLGIELRIVGPEGHGVGEIVARGPNVMRGYLGEPGLTAATLRDGWLHTGDLGRMDADGYVYIVGRLKEVIVTPAGETLSPEEVERCYQNLPGVLESCVVGMPCRAGSGEEPHLVVVPDDAAGMSRGEILGAIDARSKALPTHRRAQRVHFLTAELPTTTTLKVKRGVVRRLIEAEVPGHGGTAAGTREGAPPAASPAEQGIVGLIARLAGVPVSRLTAEAHLERDLGIDSLMRVEILAFLDAPRSRSALEDRMARAATVGDVLALAREARGDERGRPSWQRLLAEPPVERRPPVPRPGLFRATLGAARWLLERYCGIAAEGQEHLPAEGPFVLAANHASHLDAFAVLVALDSWAARVSLVGARDYFFDRTWKRLLLPRVLHIIPFDRETHFLDGLRRCREAVAGGRSLLIFPEGTRSRSGELQQFKAGIGVLAVELSLPIIPTAIQGTHEALPKGTLVPRRHPIRVTFGAALLPGTLDVHDEASPYERYRDVVERIRAAIASLQRPTEPPLDRVAA